MTYVSPGVYSRETDFSLYTPAQSTSALALVGSATRGPLDTPTLITDEGSLIDTFGPPGASHLALYAAQRYLREGNQLWYVRVASYGVATATGTLQDSGADLVTVTANSAGTWGNDISVTVGNGTDSGTYKITVKNNDFPVEVYDLIVLGSANEDDDNYIETRISGVSSFISVTDPGTSTTLDTGTFNLSGGANGTPVDNSDVIGSYGSPPTVPSTGLHCFDNPETIEIDMVAIPGKTEDTIIQAVIDLAESRKDCVGLIDCPQGMSVQQVVDWHDGVSGLADAPTAALSSSYAALYYPWLKVYDSYNDVELYVPPSGHAAQVIARTDYVADPWYAPAGLNRGVLHDVLEVEHSATQGERDYMYSGGNAVNPICKPYEGSSFVIFGQRTLQRTSTALDRINVRRMMVYLRRAVAEASKALLFAPNNVFTRTRFVNLVKPVCKSMQADEAITGFKVVCDETNNPPEVVDKSELHGKILLKPTKSVEIIRLDFVVLPSGVDFEEFV